MERPFYRDPKRQILIAVLITLLLYGYLIGRQGSATDIAYRDGFTYIAMGPSGGVRIVDMHNPGTPNEVGQLGFLGTAQRVVLSGAYLLVADGPSGMRILDVTSADNPQLISTFSTPGDTLDIAVAGHFAYLAKGGAGVTIVDFSDPANPVGVKTISLPGTANALQAMQVSTTPAPAADGSVPPAQVSTYLYVANGIRGLQVVDVTLPTAPVLMGGMDTPGEALDIALGAGYAFIADDTAGLRVVSLANLLQPVEVSSFKTKGPANKISLNGPYALVSQGRNGLTVINIANPTVPVAFSNLDPAGDVLAAAGLGPFVLLAEGQLGVQVVNFGNAARPQVISAYDTPGEASVSQVLSGLWTALHGNLDQVHAKVWDTLLIFIIDLLIVGIFLLFWLGFYAQFSLPLQTIQDRLKAFRLLRRYYLGERGPALFIQNGKLVERSHEELRYGNGVTVMDTASAAVFRTRHVFTQPAGPGILFTRPGEYPAGVVDLHPQNVSLGPLDKEVVREDPFTPKTEAELEDEYQARQARRYATSGLTRDGVEVVPTINVSFRLDCEPGAGHTGFGYDPQAVWKAIAGVGIQPNAPPGSEERLVSWEWLPGHVAVDLWREYLRKYTLDELFAYSQNQNDGREPRQQTAFDIISQMVRRRMEDEEVDEYNDNGALTGKKVPSREFQILKDRGIKILSVSIRSLRFPQEVEKQLVDQWIATWLQRAQEEVRRSERAQAEERNIGQEQALKDYASGSAQVLAGVLESDASIGPNQSLEMLLQGTLKLCIRELELNPRMTNQKAGLVELIEWIRKQ